MIKLLPLLTFLMSSCIGGQSFNSNTYDYNLGVTSNCADPSNTRLCNAMEIIQAKCVDCHDATHTSWAGNDTDEKWLAFGSDLIVKGSPDTSRLILRLKNNQSDMPKNKSMLLEEDYQILRDWITNIP